MGTKDFLSYKIVIILSPFPKVYVKNFTLY